MEILDSGEFETTEAALNTYPIADIVFVYFFRSLAINAEITSDFDDISIRRIYSVFSYKISISMPRFSNKSA